jgi:hypothetical protein
MRHSFHYAEVDPETGRVKRVASFRHRTDRDRFVGTDPSRFRVILGDQAKAILAALRRGESRCLPRALKAGGTP